MMKGILLFLGLFAFSGAHAEVNEDDLLSILNSQAGDSIVKERDELTEALRAELRSLTPQQEALLSAISKSQYPEALAAWNGAFEGTAFGKSASGQALRAFLLYQNNMQLNGIKDLFAIQEPQRVSPQIKKIWLLTLTPESNIWPKLGLEWKAAWTQFFGTEIEAKVVSWQVYDPSDTKRILSLISNTKLGTPERHWLEWQMALGLALHDDSTKAGKVLAHMLQSKQTVVSEDLIHMTAARLLYEKGYLTPAIAYYQKVPKTSEYWFEAQEEIAWSYIRKGEPQNTLAVTQSLMVPAFTAQVGPESVFLRAFGQLKVCDYPEVILAVREFKNRYKPRVEKLQSLIENTEAPAVQDFLAKSKKGRIKAVDLKESALGLPRFLARDEVTYNFIEQLAQLEREVAVVDTLAQKAGDNEKAVNFFTVLKKTALDRQAASKAIIDGRIRNLANAELSEIKDVLKKMHIIEAEVIQQMSIAKKSNEKKPEYVQGTTGSQSKYALKFPYEGETWFDEIDSYKVDAPKSCLSSVVQ